MDGCAGRLAARGAVVHGCTCGIGVGEGGRAAAVGCVLTENSHGAFGIDSDGDSDGDSDSDSDGCPNGSGPREEGPVVAAAGGGGEAAAIAEWGRAAAAGGVGWAGWTAGCAQSGAGAGAGGDGMLGGGLPGLAAMRYSLLRAARTRGRRRSGGRGGAGGWRLQLEGNWVRGPMWRVEDTPGHPHGDGGGEAAAAAAQEAAGRRLGRRGAVRELGPTVVEAAGWRV